MSLTGVWEGTLDGTNWGRLVIRLHEESGVLSGQAEINDIGVGVYNLDVAGRRDATVTLHLTPSRHAVRAYPGTISAEIVSESETLVRGTWNSTIGTHGTFRADRHQAIDVPLHRPPRRSKRQTRHSSSWPSPSSLRSVSHSLISTLRSNVAVKRPMSTPTERMKLSTRVQSLN